MNLLTRFKDGLQRTRTQTFSKIGAIFKSGKLDEDSIEELEDALLEADIGVSIVDDLIEKLKDEFANRKKDKNLSPAEILKSHLITILNNRHHTGTESCQVLTPNTTRFSHKPWVILLVGVNGSGKTTTAGKLAYYYGLQGKKSVIAACDTFRAAAVEQIEVWAQRGGARLVKQKSGADPASVAYDAYKSTQARSEDLLIVDTAGRLQSKRNLMEELGKVARVLRKHDPTAPHEVLLVIDATTGQNGLSQARGFTSVAGGTGLIITKLDGTARGGVVVPIQSELGLPVEFIGLGEGVDDLHPFDAKVFVNAIFEE
ncbi:MAG: signal recognition particle-docking protein FtsY [Candidatus Hatepunaea meridiana]|nr:signal recognition particle-docking protein FtsY [Candidatus Hatepunaea meridiana]